MHKKQTQKRKDSFESYSAVPRKVQDCRTAGIQGLALREQARRVTDCRAERGGEMAELKTDSDSNRASCGVLRPDAEAQAFVPGGIQFYP